MDYQGDAAFERTTDARRADDGRRAKRRASRVCRCDATRSYRDIDYSLQASPVWLQERVQSLFRDTMVRRIAARRAGLARFRASVVTRLRAPFANGDGYDRERSWYEARFAGHGFAVLEGSPSAQVVVDGLLTPLPWSGPLRVAVSKIARAERVLRRQNDYLNWVLAPAR